MATIITESDRFGASAEGNAAAVAASSAQRPLPDSTLAEIPVVVHASHRAAASGVAGETQTVREESTTVLIFPQGAVLTLSSKLSRGDLVVLGNRQNRADMLSRVVYVREQLESPSYVELEFTQRSPGFWSPGPVTASPAPSASRNAAQPAAPVFSLPEIARPPVSLASAITEAVSRPATATPVPAAPPVAVPPMVATPPLAAASADNTIDLTAAVETVRAQAATEADAEALPEGSTPAETSEQDAPRSLWQGVVAKLKAWSHHPMMWVICAGFTVLAFLADGYFLGHHGPSSSAEVTATPAVYPVRSASVRTSDSPSFGAAHPVISDSGAASLPPSATALPAGSSSANSKTEPVEEPGAVSTSVPATQPRHDDPRMGKMAAPTAKKSANAAAASSEPPVLPNEGSSVAETLLAAGSYANPAAPRGPAGSVPAANGAVRDGTMYEGPKLISSTPPVYPGLARTQGLEGVVVVDATIDAMGRVIGATAISGPSSLRQAAIDAVRNWRYRPAELNGEAVQSHQTVNLNFTRQ